MPGPSSIPLASTPERSNDTAIRDWCSQAIKEGEAFLQSQSGVETMPHIIDAIMGESERTSLRPSAISSLQLNHVGKIGLDLASSLTDTKPFWEYKTSNSKFDMQAEMAQKLASAWWTNRLIDLKFSDVIKYALAGGSGNAHLFWNTDTQDQDLEAWDPRDVLPIRPGSLFSIQDAFGVAMRRERTVNYLRALHPGKANAIKADREGSFAALAKNSRAVRILDALGLRSGFVQNLYSSIGGKTAAASLNVPVADMFTIYVKDGSVNETGRDQIMGDPTTNWSYIVHPGEALYPRKRCIELTRSCLLYDGPSHYWHGLFPCPKLTLDPWPWAWLGKSPLKDLLPIAGEVNRTARGIADMFEKCWRPDVIGDKNSVSAALMQRLDTRRAGLKLRTNPVAGQGLRYEWPPMQPLQVGMEWIAKLIDEMKELSGTQELTNLVQLGQIPATETIERMMEAQSPAIRLRSRVMEAFLREMAMMVLMNFFQFYTMKQRISVLGPSGMTFEDFDYDPGTMIPDLVDIMGRTPDGNPLPRHERAMRFITYFKYEIAPGSLLNASQVTNKLMYIQLARMGYLDAITLLEKLDIPNIGAPDAAGTTIMDRLQWMQQQGMGMQVGPAGASAAGRKSSGQAMPRMKISESG